jgi:hypothetical protein
MTLSSLRWSRIGIVTMAALAACGGREPEPGNDIPEDQRELAQALYASGASMWPVPTSVLTPLVIPVCWQNAPGPDVVRNGYQISENQLRAWVQDSVERGWQRYGWITFTGWGICPSNFTGIRVEGTTPGNPNTAIGAYTHRNDTTPWMHLNYVASDNGCNATAASMENCARYYALHEFGHALGFLHEEERPGYTGDKCLANNLPSLTAIEYGQYDPDSIMSYCNFVNHQLPNLPTILSAGDIAAVQRAYRRHPHGEIVTTRGDCLSGPNVAGLAFISDCQPTTNQLWTRRNQGQLSTTCPSGVCGPFPTLGCLDSGGATTNGSNLAEPACNGASTQQWSWEQMYMRGWGGFCLDLQYGDTTNGNTVQMWHCGDYGGANQL